MLGVKISREFENVRLKIDIVVEGDLIALRVENAQHRIGQRRSALTGQGDRIGLVRQKIDRDPVGVADKAQIAVETVARRDAVGGGDRVRRIGALAGQRAGRDRRIGHQADADALIEAVVPMGAGCGRTHQIYTPGKNRQQAQMPHPGHKEAAERRQSRALPVNNPLRKGRKQAARKCRHRAVRQSICIDDAHFPHLALPGFGASAPVDPGPQTGLRG